MRWGAEHIGEGCHVFRLWAPDREEVVLELAEGSSHPMRQGADGWFSAEIKSAAGDRYRFRIGDLAVPDPASRRQMGGPHGWSVLTDPASYKWRNDDWRGRAWEETVIEEVHAGTFGGFAGVAERLPQLADLGITAVELMPIGAFSGTRGWGYDGVLPYAVAEAYGTPDELKALIDRAHGLGLMVFLDVVYNHFGPDGNYLGSYASGFFDGTVDTPWGGAVAVSQEPVRRFFIDNALMWLEEYRFDGLRFDAVHAIADTAFLDKMAREIRARLPNQHIHLMLENEHNDPARLHPELYDAQWNDDFHNVLHVILTGETEGYYAGFAEDPTLKLARCLGQGFIYQGEVPPGAEDARGAPSSHLPATRFITFLQNHDQIGNRALGERLPLLTDKARLKAATALLLLCPQIPLLFMADTDGSRTPFLFFTDFDDDLADAVRNGRRGEFAAFAAFAEEDARRRIPDPNAASTFEQSKPQPGPDAEEWRWLYRELLALRHKHLIPLLGNAHGVGAQVLGEGAVTARWSLTDGAELRLAINLGHQEVRFPHPVSDPLFSLGEAGAPASFQAVLIQ